MTEYNSSRTGMIHDNDADRIATLENNISTLTTNLSTLSGQINSLQSNISSLSNQITALDNKISQRVLQSEYNFWIQHATSYFSGVVAENGTAVTVPSGKNGFFVYGIFGLATLQKLRVASGTTVEPTNTYWGSDPAPGVNKYMYYKFY